MSTITITRALSKIKTLTSSIEGDLKSNLFITTSPNNMAGSESQDKLSKTLVANKQSLDDKLLEIVKLKKLIAHSNLTTTVNISSKEVTVTEALAMKETMLMYSKFYLVLRKQYSRAAEEVTETNMRIAQSVATNTSDISSSADIKNEDLEQRLALSSKQLQETMGIKVLAGSYDSGEEYIEAVKDTVNTFVSEIDFILSEHNATTMIEID